MGSDGGTSSGLLSPPVFPELTGEVGDDGGGSNPAGFGGGGSKGIGGRDGGSGGRGDCSAGGGGSASRPKRSTHLYGLLAR